MKSRTRPTRVVLAAFVVGVALALSGLVVSDASSHREAPLISQDPVADNTDTYAFVSPDAPDTVTLVANWIPLELPAGGPNFSSFGDDVLYKINVDNNGDAVRRRGLRVAVQDHGRQPEHVPVQHRSGRLDRRRHAERQADLHAHRRSSTASAKCCSKNAPVAPANVGPRSMPNYDALAAEAVVELPDGGQSFAGPRDDPFFVDLGSVFDLLGLRPLNSAHAIPLPEESGVDGLAGFNVHSVVLQVPTSELVTSDPVIGVWSTTDRYSDEGVRRRQGQGQGQVHAGVAPGHAPGERGRRTTRCQGPVQRLRAGRRRAVPAGGRGPRGRTAHPDAVPRRDRASGTA